MNRNIAAAAAAAIYIACASWVIHSEGVSYRRSLRDARAATSPIAKAGPSPRLPEQGEDKDAPPEEPTRRAAIPSSAPVEPATPSPPAETGPLALKPADPPAAVPPPPAAGVPDRNAPAPDPIWDQPPQKKVWDLTNLKLADEMLLGRDLHGLIVHLNPTLREGPWLRRVEEAAEPLLAARDRKEIPRYTFTILDSNQVNAFSHPGGYIYISRGLFDMIGEDEDYALMFVIAHEIAHVDRGHALACLQDPEVRKLGSGTLQQFYTLIIPWGYYPDEMDYEADRWAFEQLIRLEYSVREALAFLRKFEGYAKNNGFENGREQPRPDANAALVDNHFRAHPAVWRRLKEIEKHPAARLTPAAAKPTR